MTATPNTNPNVGIHATYDGTTGGGVSFLAWPFSETLFCNTGNILFLLFFVLGSVKNSLSYNTVQFLTWE
jgi:hypothetical protein